MSDKRKNTGEEDAIAEQLKKNQVASVRNKVYIFFFGLFIFVFWPTFLSPIENVRGEEAFSIKILDPINSIFRGRGEGGLLSEIEQLDEEIALLEQDIALVEIEKEVVNHLIDEKKQNTIINCLNFDICDDISEDLLEQIDFLRIFVIIDQLEGDKMSFDQRILLRNMNEYMLRSSNGYQYGEIKFMKFGVPEFVNEDLKLKILPIDMIINFEQKSGVINFLENVENKIFQESPVMYVVDQMNYSIPEYKVEQEIRFRVNAYYFEGLIKGEDVVSSE